MTREEKETVCFAWTEVLRLLETDIVARCSDGLKDQRLVVHEIRHGSGGIALSVGPAAPDAPVGGVA